MAYVIAEPCVDVLDKTGIDECPVDCMLYIHPDECGLWCLRAGAG